MSFELHRPPGYAGKRERYLPSLTKALARRLARAQGSLVYDTLRLPEVKLEELASVLVEFAEDIHNDIGIWASLERYNIEFLGTPLPFALQPEDDMGPEAINEHRVQHLLYVLCAELNPRLLLSPTHQELRHLAALISDFLRERFAEIPRGSSVKAFLAQPNKFGWEVKRKLIWLGMHSYLFRNSFLNYVEGHGGEARIPVIDDFVCEQTTDWSGVGVTDILAGALDITEEQRSTLRSWYERHHAYYRILSAEGQRMVIENMINNEPYRVRVGYEAKQFEVGEIVLGSLVSWNGEWYWSGEQSRLGKVTKDALQRLRDSFLRKVPEIAYRYCGQLAERARAMAKIHHQHFIEYHGDDLVIYSDGLSMSADLQREVRLQWESKPSEVIAELMKKLSLRQPGPSLSFPRDLVENKNGVGVYHNPEEGWEMMTGFNHVVNGLKKKGTGLTANEEDAIRSFIWSENVSPGFVKRAAQEYGFESIESAFLIRGSHNEFHLDCLLRRHKGAYYRKRYPRVTLV